MDELTTRDVITDAIMQLPDRVVWLLLGAEGASMFGEGTLGFYASRGLFSKVSLGGGGAGPAVGFLFIWTIEWLLRVSDTIPLPS